ncbi:MAG: hypothetical protein RLZZ69_2327, partial [Cyanobacteriota bacterium]
AVAAVAEEEPAEELTDEADEPIAEDSSEEMVGAASEE